MNLLTILSIKFLLIHSEHARNIPDDYETHRKSILQEESYIACGGQMELTEEEKIANEILMKYKHRSLNESFQNPQYFNFSKHYFSYKKNIQQSKVYQIIKKMPKGAVLHSHSSMMLHADILMNFTYVDHLYACYSHDNLSFKFSLSTPSEPCQTKWALVEELRNASGDPVAFDAKLKTFFTLYREDSDEYNSMDINTIWARFNKAYKTIKSLISYRPVREKFWYDTLNSYYEDKIMYIEVRTGLHTLYELDGTTHPPKYLAEMYKRVTNNFIEDYPDFIGVKLILTGNRANDLKTISQVIETAKSLKGELPEMIAGFDLVGQEDLGRPLTEFVPLLTEAKRYLDLFLHAGETLWLGTSTDENLVDAVLLGSKRIGHGYALLKHPTLMSAVINNDIAIEVNMISNTILGLVKDVRNHPVSVYMALGFPVVISSDDPGAWDAEPLSTDFFVTFMGAASRNADLRMLKQLAMNSINYSALEKENKLKLYSVFHNQWQRFISDVISSETNVS